MWPDIVPWRGILGQWTEFRGENKDCTWPQVNLGAQLIESFCLWNTSECVGCSIHLTSAFCHLFLLWLSSSTCQMLIFWHKPALFLFISWCMSTSGNIISMKIYNSVQNTSYSLLAAGESVEEKWYKIFSSPIYFGGFLLNIKKKNKIRLNHASSTQDVLT